MIGINLRTKLKPANNETVYFSTFLMQDFDKRVEVFPFSHSCHTSKRLETFEGRFIYQNLIRTVNT
jgi:hypothetical protein